MMPSRKKNRPQTPFEIALCTEIRKRKVSVVAIDADCSRDSVYALLNGYGISLGLAEAIAGACGMRLILEGK